MLSLVVDRRILVCLMLLMSVGTLLVFSEPAHADVLPPKPKPPRPQPPLPKPPVPQPEDDQQVIHNIMAGVSGSLFLILLGLSIVRKRKQSPNRTRRRAWHCCKQQGVIRDLKRLRQSIGAP